MSRIDHCDCGSGLAYGDCCGRFHAGAEAPPTAEALMRSRYSAYCRGRLDYVHETWHPRTRDSGGLTQTDGPRPQWIGLQILAVRAGAPTDGAGEVEFIARYKIGGRALRLHEISRFVRLGGRWVYEGGRRGDKDSGSRDH